MSCSPLEKCNNEAPACSADGSELTLCAKAGIKFVVLCQNGTVCDATAIDLNTQQLGSCVLPPACGDGIEEPGELCYEPAQNFPAGENPRSVAVGDFNGDGKLDLATANRASDNVGVLLGDGAGSFDPQQTFTVGAGAAPGSIAVGDFDNDGKLDLVTANPLLDNVTVLFGTGTGSFGLPTPFLVGTTPKSVVVGDFNSDGKLDFSATNTISGDVSVLLGDGAGSFGAISIFDVGINCDSIVVGDFDSNNKLDLAIANFDDDTVSVLVNTTNAGVLSFQPQLSLPAGDSPESIAIGDFDSDGKLDLAVANFDLNKVSVLQGDGTGSFSAPTTFDVGTHPKSVAAGDFNDDGKLDLATANESSDEVSVLLGKGDGSFEDQIRFGVGSLPQVVAVGDFNRDGKPDLAVANFLGNTVSVLLSNP